MAFNGVAMANSTELKEQTTLKNEVKVAEFQQEETSCTDNAINYYESVMEFRGGGEDTALLSS